MPHPDDDRPASMRAIGLAYTIIGVSLEMVVPVLLGWGVDHWLGTKPVFAILGGALGLSIGTWSVIRLTQPGGPGRNSEK